VRRVVVLRPEPGAGATAEAARALGLEAIALPLFAVRPIDWRAPGADGLDGIVATSANAFRHGGSELERLRRLAVHAVGAATAEAARDAGFTVATVGTSGARALAEALPPGRYVHLTGVHHMAIAGVPALACYESMAIDPPPPLGALSGAVALVHSPRAGERLAELAGDRGATAIAAISDAAALACGTGWASVAVAETPTDAALLALAARLCQDSRA
jgi:uroporphyrinogen-III synthase